jgi:hypothetical protein
MSNTITTSTDQFGPTRFSLHGRVEYEDWGRLLWACAEGPFNAELMGALLRMPKATFQQRLHLCCLPMWRALHSWGRSLQKCLEMQVCVTIILRTLMQPTPGWSLFWGRSEIDRAYFKPIAKA